MKHSLLRLGAAVVALVGTVSFATPAAEATVRDHVAYQFSQIYPWHGYHYHPVYRQPLALVVPPTAGNTTEYSWGVGNTRITPIYHQFRWRMPYAVGAGGGAF
ncbi:MAG: hypothetical protein WD176_02920, partial [Pirellulales bacterium]